MHYSWVPNKDCDRRLFSFLSNITAEDILVNSKYRLESTLNLHHKTEPAGWDMPRME